MTTPSNARTHAFVARTLLGLYLCVHFIALLPYASELFSARGMLANAHASPFFGHVPGLLFLNDAPTVAYALVLLACALSACFMLGCWTRAAALLLWFVWATLFVRNPLIANPSIPFIGLICSDTP